MTIERLYDADNAPGIPDALYERVVFPDPPSDQSYVFANMVATVDGKTLLEPNRTARGLGSDTDQRLLRRLEANADGIIVGASTLRSGPLIFAPHLWRITLTTTGNLPLENRFFTDAPERAVVFAPLSLPPERASRIKENAKLRLVGDTTVDLPDVLQIARKEFGIRTLALEGGATLNGAFLENDLIDEMFLTVAPKLKGSGTLPTAIDGVGLIGSEYRALTLVSIYRDGNELYLRYRVQR